jgi:hypothetical protein
MEVHTLNHLDMGSTALKQSQIDMIFGWELTPEQAQDTSVFHPSLWKNSPYFALTAFVPMAATQSKCVFSNDDAMKHIPFPCLYGLWEKQGGEVQGFALSTAYIHAVLENNFGYNNTVEGELSLFEVSLFENYFKNGFETKNGGELSLGSSIYTLAPLWNYADIEETAIIFDDIQLHFYESTQNTSRKDTAVLLKSITISEAEFKQLKVGESLSIGTITPQLAYVQQNKLLKAFTLNSDDGGYFITEK